MMKNKRQNYVNAGITISLKQRQTTYYQGQFLTIKDNFLKITYLI